MDFGLIGGIVVGFACILIGNILEGGTTKSIYGPVAFMIVVGGAFGATLVEFPMPYVKKAFSLLMTGIFPKHHHFDELIEQIVRLATIARKDGLLALEKERDSVTDPLLKEGLKGAIDGLEASIVSSMIDARASHRLHEANTAAKFWGQLGAYCPTVGIVGAVLGLIVVMNNLQNPEKIGPGIAVAFVATVYGVSFSNLVFMPFGNRLKTIIAHDELYFEVIKTGIRDMQQGTSPSIISQRLYAILDQEDKAAQA